MVPRQTLVTREGRFTNCRINIVVLQQQLGVYWKQWFQFSSLQSCGIDGSADGTLTPSKCIVMVKSICLFLLDYVLFLQKKYVYFEAMKIYDPCVLERHWKTQYIVVIGQLKGDHLKRRVELISLFLKYSSKCKSIRLPPNLQQIKLQPT